MVTATCLYDTEHVAHWQPGWNSLVRKTPNYISAAVNLY